MTKAAKFEAGELSDLDPRQLERRIVFEIFIDGVAPHECGPMTVTIDPAGLSCHWLGAPREPWDFTWADLRHWCERLRHDATRDHATNAPPE